jgi:hypothetical protein
VLKVWVSSVMLGLVQGAENGLSSVVFGLVQGAENGGEQRGVFYRVLKVWVSNIILFIVLFFCTSPAYLISQLETLPFLNPKTIQGSDLHFYVTEYM